jgi:C-terminal processing protease CtpA/Prc
LPERHLDLVKLRAIYQPQAEAATTPEAWLHVVEHVVEELHDHHATLGRNAPSSPQLIPTGTDLWAEMRSDKAILAEIRDDSPAKNAGLKAGDIILTIDGVAADKAIAAAMPRALAEPDAEAANFALRTLLAGTHNAPRRFTVRDGDNRVQDVVLAPFSSQQSAAPITWRKLDAATGYIRIENSLGDSAAIAAFDNALANLSGVSGLILDLRDTPSGGNTDVAEPMLGRFTAESAAYQRVFDPAPGKQYPKDSWLKILAPRAPAVTARLVVLVDHWTGSMGEGMTVGLAALHRATIVGTRMAGLSGGTSDFTLPNTGIGIHFPTKQLYTVSGAPRENFVPPIFIDMTQAKGADPILARGLAVLHSKSIQ